MAERQDGDTKVEVNTAGSADLSKRAAKGADFYLYVFKVKPCFRTYPHCWSSCPYVHPGEKARRRDPKRYGYSPVPCPYDIKGGEKCPQGDGCNFTHNVYEFHLHPMRFRTALCQDRQSCNRQLCFFAHSPEELRRPSMAVQGPMELGPSQHTAHGPAATAMQPAGMGMFDWPGASDDGLATALGDSRAEHGPFVGGWAMPAVQGAAAAVGNSRAFGATNQVEPDSDVLTVLSNFRQRRSAAAAAAAAAGADRRFSEDAAAGALANTAAAAEAAPSYGRSVYNTGMQLGLVQMPPVAGTSGDLPILPSYQTAAGFAAPPGPFAWDGPGYDGSSVPQMVLLDRQQQLQQQQQQGDFASAQWARAGHAEASGIAGQAAAGVQPLMYTAVPAGGTLLSHHDSSEEKMLQQQYMPPQHMRMAPHQHQQLQQQQLQALQAGVPAYDASTPVLQSQTQQAVNQQWQGQQLLLQQHQQYNMASLSSQQGVGPQQQQQQQYPAAAMMLLPQQQGQQQQMPGIVPLAGQGALAGANSIAYGPAGYGSGSHAVAAYQPAGCSTSTSNSNSSLKMQPAASQSALQAQLLMRQQASAAHMVAVPTSGTLSAPLLYMLPSQGAVSGTLSAVDGSTGLSAEALAGVLHQLSMFECSVEDL